MTKIILILLLLSGCNARHPLWGSSAYSLQLECYVGRSENSLYGQWDAPDNVINTSQNQKVVSYTEYYVAPLGGQAQAYANEFNYGAMNAGFEAENTDNYYCTTSFTIQNGVVTNYSFNGDDCVAK